MNLESNKIKGWKEIDIGFLGFQHISFPPGKSVGKQTRTVNFGRWVAQDTATTEPKTSSQHPVIPRTGEKGSKGKRGNRERD